MYIKIGTTKIPADLNPQMDEISKHTGKTLKCFRVSIIVKSRVIVDEITDLLSKPRNQVTIGDDSGKEVDWKVRNSGYSYHDTESPIYNYWIDVIEIEDLNVEKLIIDDLELVPYYYNEVFFKDYLNINTKVKIDKETYESLVDLFLQKKDIEVTRIPLSNERRNMGLVLGSWSEDNDMFKVWVLLQDISEDKDKNNEFDVNRLIGSQLANLARESIAKSNAISKLLGIMKDNNQLSEKDFSELTSILNSPYEASSRRYDFSREEDID